MYEMPTELQYKDELRKERIRIEDELEMLRSKEYEKLRSYTPPFFSITFLDAVFPFSTDI